MTRDMHGGIPILTLSQGASIGKLQSKTKCSVPRGSWKSGAKPSGRTRELLGVPSEGSPCPQHATSERNRSSIGLNIALVHFSSRSVNFELGGRLGARFGIWVLHARNPLQRISWGTEQMEPGKRGGDFWTSHQKAGCHKIAPPTSCLP